MSKQILKWKYFNDRRGEIGSHFVTDKTRVKYVADRAGNSNDVGLL